MVPTAAAGVEAVLTAAGLPHRALYDWGGGLVWLLVDSPEAAAIRALPGLGHATLVRPLPGMEDVPAFHPEPAALAALTAGLRAKVDPRGLFNPGIMD
jgi:glycolate oxidase FAD binding subunit